MIFLVKINRKSIQSVFEYNVHNFETGNDINAIKKSAN